MQFIPNSPKTARLWVDAITKSLSIDKAEVAAMYSNMCGFKSWDRLISAIQTSKPSTCDEHCSQDIIETRKAFYSEILESVFGFNPDFSDYLISHASPSSNSKPTRFSINREELYEPPNYDSFRLGDMFKEAGLTSPEGIDNQMREFFKEALGDELPDDFSFDNLTERLRISKPIFPGYWYNLLDTLEWSIDEDSYSAEYVYGEESFVVLGKNDIEIPVYITSLSRVPLDHDDEMANNTMSIVREHCETECGADKAILFWGAPLVKKIKDEWFSHFGMCLRNGQWHEFLLNENSTLDNVLNQVETLPDIDNPNVEFCDKHKGLATGFVRLAHEIEHDQTASIMSFGSPSGWTVLIPSIEE